MIVLSILLGLNTLFLMSAIIHIRKIQKELIGIDREQHEQNKEIIELMKYKLQHDEMLLQHIEILKYLCDQDPILNRKVEYYGPIGEA
jgi:hypothetical protein